MRIIRFGELTESPWKNGGGITREIADLRSGRALVWRLSMADVAGDGAFSRFARLVRILTVIRGNGMTLAGPGVVLDAGYGAPVRFDGGDEITATLKDGPLRDLNLMFDPLLCDGEVTPMHGPCRQSLEAGRAVTFGVHCLAGVAGVGADAVLHPGDTALVKHELVEMTLDAGAAVLLIRLAGIQSPQLHLHDIEPP